MKDSIIKKYLSLKYKICISKGFDPLEKYSIKDLILIYFNKKTPNIKLEEKIKKEKREILGLIKSHNVNNKLIDETLLSELFRVKVREYNVSDICLGIKVSSKKTLKRITKIYNRYDPKTKKNREIKVYGIECVRGSCNYKRSNVILYYDSVIESSKLKYQSLKRKNEITITENEFINSQLIFVLLHELTHAKQLKEVRQDTEDGKILADCFRIENKIPKMNREDKLIERMADVNAICNLNILADAKVFSKELKLYTESLKKDLLLKEYNYQEHKIEYPSDKYNLTNSLGNCDYERALNGFRIPEENYKKLVRKISD